MTNPFASAGPRAQDHASDGLAELEAGHLSRPQLVSLALASFVPAVGMALVPFLMFSYAGMVAWPAQLVAAAATISIGLAIITFSRRFVVTGSLYSYIGHVFGPWARFITAASLLLGFVMQVASIAGISGIFLGSFLTSLGVAGGLEVGVQAFIYLAVIGVSALVAIRGLDISVGVAIALAVLSVPLMVVITVASGVHTGLELSTQFAMDDISFTGVFQGVAVGAAFLISFESCSALAAETKDPKRNVPIAVMSVPIVLGMLYLLTTMVQLPGLAAASDQLAAGASPPAALALQSGLGKTVATATDLVLAAATFAALIAFINYGSRFVATLGADGFLPRSVASVSHRLRTPVPAIGVLAALGFALMTILVLVTGDITTAYNSIATLLVYSWVPAYLVIAAGAIVLTLRDRRVRVGLIVASVFGAAVMAWLYLNGIFYPPPAPYDAMSWVAVVLLVSVISVLAGFAAMRRRQDASRML